ncbi:hypothetical protein [Leucobacter soli]|uniref:hypothetical protein n=1 Tax=Leucobacter soli TaxID=2812850 RepID=UPI0036102229
MSEPIPPRITTFPETSVPAPPWESSMPTLDPLPAARAATVVSTSRLPRIAFPWLFSG